MGISPLIAQLHERPWGYHGFSVLIVGRVLLDRLAVKDRCRTFRLWGPAIRALTDKEM